MISVRCRTNLDIDAEWPDELPAKPAIGEYIESTNKYSLGRRIILEICGIIWRFRDFHGEHIYLCEIELTYPRYFHSLSAFEDYYRSLKGQK